METLPQETGAIAADLYIYSMTTILRSPSRGLWLNFLLILLLAACQKDKTVAPARVNAIISAFKFELSDNPSLSEDQQFSISDKSIAGAISPESSRSLVATFITDAKEVSVNGVKQESGKTAVDFSNDVVYKLVSKDGSESSYTVHVNWIYDIPHLYIITEGSAPIMSKTDYVLATYSIDGNGGFEDYSGTTKIRGRGNSTWGMPKKPYRLKLDNAASLFDLPASKNWVLLANYLDGTLMLNSVAMKTGQLLNMPYTNHIIPVDLTINNEYAGSYVLTEQVEVGPNRLPAEAGAMLLELDQNFDEPWEFKSNHYDLPVMLKYPSLASETELEPVKTAFHALEDLVADPGFPANNYTDFIDTGSLVRYFIVHMLTDNEEINHPKSTYMYKPASGKFIMGPIWDFDWAFGFEGTGQYFNTYDMQLFWWNRPEPGTNFFSRFLLDPALRQEFKQQWASFKSTQLAQLLKYVDDYANQVEKSRKADYSVWQTGSGNFRSDVRKLYKWLENRASYIDIYAASL